MTTEVAHNSSEVFSAPVPRKLKLPGLQVEALRGSPIGVAYAEALW
jgi:hypothetical protein